MQSRPRDRMNPESSGRERRSRIIERGDSSLRSVYNDPLSNPRDQFETTPPGMHLERSTSRVVCSLDLLLAPIGMFCQGFTYPFVFECSAPALPQIKLVSWVKSVKDAAYAQDARIRLRCKVDICKT